MRMELKRHNFKSSLTLRLLIGHAIFDGKLDIEGSGGSTFSRVSTEEKR